ncbi:MAG: tetratricopeptide repeat protein [Fermentimonas sp.]|nr:tetratricopeptide repeat protein [Fermentimonas sp.]
MKRKSGNIFLSSLCVILGLSCSTGRNTPSSRAYHELRTRYNIFHSTQETYDNLLDDPLTIFPENSFELLSMFPYYSDKDKLQAGGPFDIVIDKTEKAISDHSISAKPRRDPAKAYSEEYRNWLRQEEFNPFIYNVWLLLGKAHLQNGDYDQALSVFSVTVKIFPDDLNKRSEVQIWMLRAYTEMKRYYDAQNLIYILNSRKLPDKLNRLFTEFQAHYLLESGQFTEAAPLIRKEIEGEKNSIRKKRLQFLLGQLYVLTGDYGRALNSFKDLKRINTPKDLYLNATDYQLALSSGKQQADSIALLLKQNLIKEEIKTVSDKVVSASDENSQLNYKDTFHLYWEANLKRDITNPVLKKDSNTEVNKEFTTDKLSPHLLILLPSDQSVRINELLYTTANFNFSKFKLRTYNITPIRLNMHDALKLESFNSFEDASNYLQLLRSDTIYRSTLAGSITPVIISVENYKILQNNSLEDYKLFYLSNIDKIPEDITAAEILHQEEGLLKAETKEDKNYVEESLSLKPDSISVSGGDSLKVSDEKATAEVIRELKSTLEQKAAEMMQRTKESVNVIDRSDQLKKREQLRNERIRQREKELKERERKREIEIKQREKERELKLRSQKRDIK